jgi:non-ribosomal peptide synthetase component F
VEFLHSLDPDTGKVLIKSLSYYDLNSRANQLAHYLTSQGVTGGDFVSIILEKSLDLYVSILAVIKIGAGYLPVLPSTPDDRLHFILAEAKPRCAITDKDGQRRLWSSNSVPSLDVQDSRLNDHPDTNVAICENASDAAYIIFTSGSTGEPKGVLISHHNLCSNIAMLMKIYPIGSQAKMLQACSQAFDGQLPCIKFHILYIRLVILTSSLNGT